MEEYIKYTRFFINVPVRPFITNFQIKMTRILLSAFLIIISLGIIAQKNVGENTIVNATGDFSQYFWSTGNRTNNIVVSDTGTYWLTVLNANQCKSTEKIIVINNDICRYVYFPNGFTPNHDNLNDNFIPKVYGLLSRYKLSILNRWGNKIIETTNYKTGWDGTYKGEAQNSGTYVWMAEYQFDGMSLKTEQGTVILIR